MNTKTIIGRIGNTEIPEHILQYDSEINEMILTAKKNIQKKFEALGYNPCDVVFDE